jgi:hypothetical protein
MHRESHTFTVRIELEASFDDDYEGDDDGGAWLRRFHEQTRPQLVAAVMRVLAADRSLSVRPQTRGRSPEDEIEIGVALQTTKPQAR